MISFKEFLTEDHPGGNVMRSWKTKEAAYIEDDIAHIYKVILAKCPSLPQMIQNGGILFRGWSYGRGGNAYSPSAKVVSVIDTTASHRLSRDTNNFYQVCLDYSPAMSAVPSRTTSLITATHVDTAVQFGSYSIIIPFENTTIAVSKHEDMFWQTIGPIVTVEELSNFAGDYIRGKKESYYTIKDVPSIKATLDSWDKNKIERIGLDDNYPHVLELFTQFKTNRFDNFCNRYITPSKLGISIYHTGDKFPVVKSTKRGVIGESRFSGNEAWFTGKAFSIPYAIWNDLIEYAKKDLKLKVHRNCDVKNI